jgi:multimeric flavodoxin WrbA
MNVVAIQGSPRRGGNTEIVLEAVLAGLAEKTDAAVTTIRSADKDIAGCSECFTCQTVSDAPGCAIDDDMGAVYEALLGADLILLASPVFCWSVTAQLKAVLDRLYACFKFNESPPLCLLAGRDVALVVTAGGGRNDGADLCEGMFERLATMGQANDRGRLICPFLQDPSQTRRDTALLERARQFGASLASREA